MPSLYLIAHKVRGQPAFDVAIRMQCPLCAGHGHDLDGVCHECDSLGYWWIIPTSGHRAYPYWHQDLMQAKFGLTDDCLIYEGFSWEDIGDVGAPPPSLPDHYPTAAAPRTDLLSALGLTPKPAAPAAPIQRRF
jgi:hypothetical protein